MARFSAILAATLVALGAVAASPIEKRSTYTGSATYTAEGLVSQIMPTLLSIRGS